jgi:hypothetical protein
MRCRDAKIWLNVQRNGNHRLLTATIEADLQEHLCTCESCRTYGGQRSTTEVPVYVPTKSMYTSISTDQIMHAVKQQQRVTQQLEELRERQHLRIKRIRTAGATGIAIGMFVLSSMPLLLLIMLNLQTDATVDTLSWLNGFLDVLFILIQYLQKGLIVLMYDSWLLSGVAFAMVIMMGLWLRLMHAPQEA